MTRYNVFEVPSATVGGYTRGSALSQSGGVTGGDFSEASPGATMYPFVYASGATRDIDVFGAEAISSAINARGDIAGYFGRDPSFAFLVPAATGVPVNLHSLLPSDAVWSAAIGISNSGEIAGAYWLVGTGPSVFYHDDVTGTLLLDSVGHDIAYVYALNNSHEIVGQGRAEPGYKYNVATRAFAPIPFYPASINDAGLVVGNYDAGRPARMDAAGAVADLPTLGGDICGVSAVNNLGHIVGAATRTPGPFGWMTLYGVLITGSTISVLDDLIIRGGDPWHVINATGIDDSGVILAQARRPSDTVDRAVLLVPFPTLPGGGTGPGGGGAPGPSWPHPSDPFERFRQRLRDWLNRMPAAAPPTPWPPPVKDSLIGLLLYELAAEISDPAASHQLRALSARIVATAGARLAPASQGAGPAHQVPPAEKHGHHGLKPYSPFARPFRG